MKHSIFAIFIFTAFACSTGIDVAKVEEELLLADTEFSNLSVEKGFSAAFESYCSQEGVLLRPDALPITGKEAVNAAMNETDNSGIRVSWEPAFAKAAMSGELGYTYGIFTVRTLSDSLVSRGTYVTIWEKTGDGWKFLLDSGNDGLGE